MKKLLLFTLFLFFSNYLFSQTTTLTADGELEITNVAPNKLQMRIKNFDAAGYVLSPCQFGNTYTNYGFVEYKIYKDGNLISTIHPESQAITGTFIFGSDFTAKSTAFYENNELCGLGSYYGGYKVKATFIWGFRWSLVSSEGWCFTSNEVSREQTLSTHNLNISNQNATICNGESITFQVGSSNNDTFTFYKDAAATLPHSASGNSLTLMPSNYTIGQNDFYVKINNCQLTVKKVSFTVNEKPNNLVINSYSSSQCKGSQVLITPNANGNNLTYEWSTNQNFVSGSLLDPSMIDAQGRLNYLPTTAGNFTYYCRAKNPSGCYSNVESVYFTVNNDISNVTFNNNSVFCNTQSISFTAGSNGGTNYQWYKDSLGAVSIGSGNQMSLSSSNWVYGANTIYLKVSNSGCSTTLIPVSFTVNQTPTNLQTTGNNNNYCIGNPVIITPTATSLTAVGFDWSLNSNFATLLDPSMVDSQGRLNYIPITAGTFTYYVRAKSNSGECYSSSTSVSFTVSNQVSNVTVTPNNPTVCAGSPVTFTASATNATSYKWTTDPLGVNAIGTTSAITLQPTQYVIGANTIYLSVINGGGCNATPMPVTFIVNESPTNIEVTGALGTYCTGSQVLITPSAIGTNLSYQWSANSNFTTLLDASMVDSQGHLNFSPSTTGTQTYYVRAFNGSCYSTTKIVTFTVNTGVSNLQVTNNGGVFCQGQPFSFTAGALNATTYSWYKFSNATGLIQTGSTYTPQSTDYIVGSLTTIYLQASNGNGCQTSLLPITYTVNPSPENLQISGNSNNYCVGNTVLITPSATMGGSSSNVEYDWSLNSNFATLLDPSMVDSQGRLNYIPTSVGAVNLFVRAKSNNNCHSPVVPVSFTINSNIGTVSVTNQNTTVCAGSPVTFTAGATGATSYLWYQDSAGTMPIGSSQSITIQPIQYSLGINKIYVKAVGAGGCSSQILPVSFTVNQSPSNLLITGGQPTYCVGSQILVTPSATGTGLTYEWSTNSNFTTLLDPSMVDSQGRLNYIPTSVGAVNLFVRAFNGSCYSSTVSYNFTVNTGVNNLQVTNNGGVFCQGQPFSFTAGAIGATSFNWYKFSNGTGSLSTGSTYTPQSTDYILDTPTTIYIQASNGNGCQTSLIPVSYTVYTKPYDLQLSGNSGGYCLGSSILIQPSVSVGTGTPTFEWSTTSNFANLLGASFVDAMGNLSYLPSSSGTFTYYVRAKGNGGCYSDTKTVTFTVSNQVSNISVTPNNPIVCAGSPVTFTASATNATSYSWSSDSQGVNVIGTASVITIQSTQYVSGTNTIYLKVNNGGGCNTTPTPISFIVNESPTNIEVTGALGTYCTGSQVLITPSAIGTNLSYQWSANSNFTTLLDPSIVDSQGRLNFSPSTTGTQTYYVRAYNGSCYSTIKTVTFTVNTGVSNLQVTNNGSSFCQGNIISFTAGALNATTYSWYKFSNGTGLLGTGATFTPSTSQYVIGNNTIYVQASSGNNCTTALLPITFTVYSVPSNLQVTGNNNTYCLGVPIFIEPTATGGQSNIYEWSITSNFANLLGSSFVDAAGNLSYVPSGVGTFTYYVRAKGNGGCYSDTKTVTFTVSNQVSNITVTPNNPTVCAGSPVTFTASATNATSYSWSSDSQGVNVIGTTSVITLQSTQYVSGTNTIYLKVGNAGNCNITPIPVSFIVNESPSALVVTGAQTSYCSGTPILITPSTTITSGTLIYQWSTTSNFQNILGSSMVDSQGSLNFSPSTTGTQTYYVRASNGNGCYSNTETVTFNITQGVSNLQVSNNNGVFCQGQSFSFTAGATGATSFNYFKFPNGTGLLGTGATYTPSPSDYVIGSNTIYVQAVSANSACSTAINAINFTVNESPTGIAYTGDLTYCLGENVLIIPSAVGTNLSYQWSSTSNFAASNILGSSFVDAMGNLSYVPTTTGSKTYYVRAYNGNCYSAGTSVTFTISAQPTSLAVNKLTNIGQTSYCQNGTIERYLATGVNITSYKWYIDPSLTQEVLSSYVSGTNNNTLNVDPSIWAVGNYNIYCVGENSNGCKTLPNIITFSVINGITPITPSINNFTMCQSESKIVNLDNPNNFTISWFTNSAGTIALSNSYISNNGNTLTLPASSFNVGQTTLYYKIQNAGGCASNLSSLSFTVLASPSNLVVTNNNASACIGQNIVFEASAQNATEFLWFKNYATGLVAEPQYVSGTNNYKLTIPSGNFAPGTYTYTLVAKNTSGCLTNPINVNFTVQSVPSNSTITGAVSYCKSENVHFELLNSSSTVIFKWYKDANALTPVDPIYLSSNGNILDIPASTFTTGNHTLYYYTTNGSCGTPMQTISFDIKDTPSNLNTSGNQGTYCYGNQIDIVVGSQGGATNYEWFQDPSASLQINPIYIIGSMNERLSSVNYPIGNHTVYVRAVNANGCKSALLSISFSVNTAPVISSFATNNATIQTGLPINFNINGTGYSRWKILFNGSQIAPTGGGWNQGNVSNYIVNNSATLGNAGNYTLIISNGTCETQSNFTLYVVPQITITHDKLANIGSDNGETKVILNQHDNITFSSSVGTNSNYSEEWEYGDGFNNTSVQGHHFYNNSGEFTVKLKVKNLLNGDIFNLQYQYPVLVKPENNVIPTDALSAPDTNYTIYPNPYKEFLGLKFEGSAGDKFVLRVYSITGLSLFNADWIADGVNWNKKWYNPLFNAPQGTYIVIVHNVTKGTKWTGKLLKQ